MDIDWDDVMVRVMRWPNFAVYWERYWPQKETASDSELSGGEIYGENEPLATRRMHKSKSRNQTKPRVFRQMKMAAERHQRKQNLLQSGHVVAPLIRRVSTANSSSVGD